MTEQQARDTIRETRVQLESGEIATCPVSGAKERLATIDLPCGGAVYTTWDTIERVHRRGTHLIL